MLIAIGLLIGLVLGLTGAGGSVFAVPLLILLGGFSVNAAIGLSLGAVAASALYGSLSNWRGKSILWKPAIILAASGATMAPIGKWLGDQLPENMLLIAFSLLAIVIAIRMFINARRNPENAKIVRSSELNAAHAPGYLCRLSPNGQLELRPRCLSGLIAGGLFVGLLSGLFGVGGGFLIVPLLLFLGQVGMVQAVSSSLVIITVISSAGFISHLLLGFHKGVAFDWPGLGLIAAGGVLGMIVGQTLSRRIANAHLQQLFAVGLIAISLITVLYSH